MKIGCEKGGIIAGHGTERTDFTSFDVSRAAPYNVGLHFGTRAAAQSCVDYLCTQEPSGDFRLLRCSLSIRNPFRIDVDMRMHRRAKLGGNIRRSRIPQGRASVCVSIASAVEAHIPIASVDAIVSIASEADGKIPSDAFGTNASTHDAFNRRLNVSLRNLFRSLGYDGLFYANEIESPSE